jgi:excisionase family DNA binding protein
MSSNIKVQRVCKHCGNEFTAKTTVTQYCGDRCAKLAYKARARGEKVEASNQETYQFKTQHIEALNAKAFLTVQDVAKLLNCSLRTTYRLIKEGNIKAVNISERKTLIRRSDIDSLFEQSHPLSTPPLHARYDVSDCYNLTEVQAKFRISEKALHELIKRNDIPKIKRGWFAYVPKPIIDNLLS